MIAIKKNYRPRIKFRVKLIVKKYKNFINKQVQQKKTCRPSVRGNSNKKIKNLKKKVSICA